MYFIVQSAGQCFAEFEAQGIQPTNELATMPWGAREFLITDPVLKR
jgi:uncharacterized glyoxalase superfamily protein PhnB